MRVLSAALCVVAAALLAGCSGDGSPQSSSVIPGSVGGAAKSSVAGHHGVTLSAVSSKFLVKKWRGFHGRVAPDAVRRGIYAQQFETEPGVFGYTKNNRSNNPSICSVTTETSGINGIGVDSKGDLIVPDTYEGIYVFKGPGMCGTLLGIMNASTLPPSEYLDLQSADAAAIDAATGTVVVGFVGAVATCTLATLTCTELDAPNLASFAQVAMDKSGNCYVDGEATSYDINLWYFAGCTGTGLQLTSANGFSEPADGGIDIDNKGNLVVLAQGEPSTFTVYSGCSTGTCTVVTGPTNLDGAGDNDCIYGRLGRQNERFVCGDYTLGQVDIYSYVPGRVPGYLYSFNNGLSQGDIVEAAAYNPRSPSK
jgi:hypothetical protein